MADLSARDFGAFFDAVYRDGDQEKRPFPWQERLLESIAASETGRWPDLLDLPTGSGKTAAIDVAVFHLALEAARQPAKIRAPRRIVLVVDRRTVVDQAYSRAKRIAQKLEQAKDGILVTVRERLASLSSEGVPLARAQLRGGMPRDDAWARSPDQPLVAVSTVDQVGSRILFRGYGVSDTMRPIHAGLLGNDTLFLLDEVHLSHPFLQTLKALARYRSLHLAHDASPLPDRWQVVPMSATPGEAESRFQLAAEDREHPVLQRRLRASKPVTCDEVKVSGAEGARRRRFAEELAKHALAQASGSRAVAVVVNRVATALEVHSLVSEGAEKRKQQIDVELVTGRMRPLDRDDLDAKLGARVASGRDRAAATKPVVVVATQCIEAGADYDFDALVSECASLAALRQRFGRLNRLGDLTDPTPGAILVRSDSLGEKGDDPLYGTALKATWTWLTEAPRDFGIEAMEAALTEIGHEKLATMLPPERNAPVMLPSHLDAWSQTTPVPRPDPDVSFWLHGKDQKADADVQIVWRADIGDVLGDVALVGLTPASLDELQKRIELCAPTGLEALSVPISAARAWLSGPQTPEALKEAADFGDVDGVPNDSDSADRPKAGTPTGQPAFLWQGDKSDVIYADKLRPGMTIVVPSDYGGILRGTWDPSTKVRVADLGDRGRWKQSNRPVLRLNPAVLTSWPDLPTTLEGIPCPISDEATVGEERAAVIEWLEKLRLPDDSWLNEVVGSLLENKKRITLVRILPTPSNPDASGYFGVVGRKTSTATGDATTDDEGSSHTGIPISLRAHMKGVGDFAASFGQRCGLAESLINDLRLAGRWHDAGKVDPRFQRWLHGGSPLADVASTPLAKSRIVMADRSARIRARERSGYPRGARHELASIALLEHEDGASLLEKATDRDLVLHLVASHHGWCRPFAPVVEDREPVDLTLDADGTIVTVRSDHGLEALDSGVAERFWSLSERYGWFGLAWLESILRLADHRRSALEQSGGAPQDEEEDP